LQFLNDTGDGVSLPIAFSKSGTSSVLSGIAQTLAPYSTVVVNTAGMSSDPTQTGSALFFASGGIDGYLIFHWGPSGQEAMVPLETRNANSYTLTFDNTNGYATGVAVATVASTPAFVPVVIRDETGAQIATGNLSVPPFLGFHVYGHTAFMLNDQFPITANKRGTVEFDTPTNGRISAIGLRAAPSGAFTTIPVLANVSSDGAAAMAQVASGGGVKSSIVLINAGTNAARAHLAFLDDNGNPLTLPLTFPQTGSSATSSTVDRTLAPGATVVIESYASDATQLVGSAQLTSNGSVSGYVVLGTPFNGQEAVVPLETRNAGAYLLVFDNTNGLVTGVAVANAATSAASIPVVIRDDTGALIGSDAISLAAGGHTSFVLTNRYTLTAGRLGTIEFDTPPGGSISAIGLRFTSTGAFTTIPVLAQ
jgi:hypothetical protein